LASVYPKTQCSIKVSETARKRKKTQARKEKLFGEDTNCALDMQISFKENKKLGRFPSLNYSMLGSKGGKKKQNFRR
jgi:hypothetical protein